jgi:hypothetical protein
MDHNWGLKSEGCWLWKPKNSKLQAYWLKEKRTKSNISLIFNVKGREEILSQCKGG